MRKSQAMITVPVQFTAEQLLLLRQKATRDGGRSLASVVRAAVDEFIDAEFEASVARSMAQGGVITIAQRPELQETPA